MKKVIIAPHVDDEVLGCTSILDDHSHVHFCGIEDFHIIPKAERLEEIGQVSSYLGYSWSYEYEQIPNHYDVRDFVDKFEELIRNHCPEEIYIPYPSYNQDHKQIYHAAMVALRPHDRNHFVKKIFVYEELDCLWMNPDYEVNYFVPFDIERKINANAKHKSQVRGHRSVEHIEALAILRGSMIGVSHAEAFIIKRWVK